MYIITLVMVYTYSAGYVWVDKFVNLSDVLASINSTHIA